MSGPDAKNPHARNQHDWEVIASRDPWFGVLTADEFRSDRIDDAARQRFFQTGKDNMDVVLGWFDEQGVPSAGRISRRSELITARTASIRGSTLAGTASLRRTRQLLQRRRVSITSADEPSTRRPRFLDASSGVEDVHAKVVVRHRKTIVLLPLSNTRCSACAVTARARASASRSRPISVRSMAESL